ncbi:MAG: septum formation initiator family protein [Oxalobacteraceae bacterium]|nr:MAG: septum formation initiator family protein [Oxalobacteraceae bacterium]
MLQKIPPFFRNFYVATALALLVWMAFFDANNFIVQFRNLAKLNELQREIDYYSTQIDTVRADQREVLGSDRLREKYAREKYLMKKPTEDVFVVVDSLNEPLEK